MYYFMKPESEFKTFNYLYFQNRFRATVLSCKVWSHVAMRAVIIIRCSN